MKKDAYLADLAYIHDKGFNKFASEAAIGLLEIFQEYGLNKCQIVELGCGSGTLAKILTEKKFSVYGIDYSDAMLKLARKNAPGGTFGKGSLWEHSIPPCDIVLSVGECLNYEFDGIDNTNNFVKLFEKIYNALSCDGIFVFDILCEHSDDRTIESRKFTEGEDWLVTVERKETRNTITRKIISFRQLKTNYRKSTEIHNVRLYKPELIKSFLEKAGFIVRIQQGYGQEPIGDNHVVMIASKGKITSSV